MGLTVDGNHPSRVYNTGRTLGKNGRIAQWVRFQSEFLVISEIDFLNITRTFKKKLEKFKVGKNV